MEPTNRLGIQTEENQLTPDGEIRELVDHNTIQWGSYPNSTGTPGIGAGVPIPVPPPSIGGNVFAPFSFSFSTQTDPTHDMPTNFTLAPVPPLASGIVLVFLADNNANPGQAVAHLTDVQDGLGNHYTQVPGMFLDVSDGPANLFEQTCDCWMCATARHPHQRRCRLAAGLLRRLDGLRGRLQPPPARLKGPR